MAAGSKAKTFWLDENEGARLIDRIRRAVLADASVSHEVREELARALPRAIRTDPAVQGAIVLLLSGEQVDQARGALAELVARLMRNEVKWPEGFTAEQFGAIAAGHAVAAVNEVKATDRAAAHVDAKYTREQIDGLPDKVARAVARSVKLSLRPPFSASAGTATPDDSVSLLTMLRASERRFDLVGRDQIMERAKKWIGTPAEDSDHRVMIVHGPGGAGKTRLAGEILALAESDGWLAGFLTAPAPEAWDELAHPSQPLAIAIDYSEARRADLQRLFRDPPVGHHPSAPLRVLLLVREGKLQSETWAKRLGGPVDLGSRGQRLLSDEKVEVVSLVDSLPQLEDRARLWSAAGKALGRVPEPPSYLVDRPFERPLYVLFDAHRQATKDPSEDPDGSSPPTVGELLHEVLKHERNYWVKARSEFEIDLDEIRMNQVAVLATLVGGADRGTFESALGALPWLAKDDELRRRVVQWWGAVYATSNDAVRGVEPDPVGEYLVVRALEAPESLQDELGGVLTVAQVTEMVAGSALPARQRILRFLTMIARNEDFEGSELAQTALGEILSRHLDELLPSAFASAGDEIERAGAMGESLATTVAAAAVAANALSLLAPASGETDMSQPGAQGGSEDLVRNAALQLIRNQVERIAAQELEGGRWSSDRYLEIVQWAVMLDLRSGNAARAAHSIIEIAGLDPRPRRQLALLLLELGRHHAEKGHHGKADEAYREALEELEGAEEENSTLAYVIWHDRGAAAMGQDDLRTAIEYHQRAVEGKNRSLGTTEPDTIASVLALSYVTAMLDLEGALRLLDETVEKVADGPDELVERVNAYRPQLPFAAARSAEREERWADAELLYRQTLEQLGALDDEDSRYSEHVIQHDLGDVAAARGDHPAALDWFEKAFAGKAAVRGLTNPGTIITLERLTAEISRDSVDAALERLREVRVQLEGSDGRGDLLVRLGQREISMLANAGRFEEATAATRGMQEAQADVFVNRAILEANGDQTTDAEAITEVAIQSSVLASRVFASGDMRLAALGSRLADAISLAIGALVTARMSVPAARSLLPPDIDQAESLPIRAESYAEFEATYRRMASAVPDLGDFVNEGVELLTVAVDRALENAVIASLSSASEAGSVAPVEDRATRSWLARTIFAGGDEESRKQAAASLFIFYVHLRLEGLPPSVRALASSTALAAPGAEEVVRIEQNQLVEDFQQVEGMDESQAERLVAAARVRAVHRTARRLHSETRWEECERLYGQAIGEAKAIGEDESAIGYALRHDFGSVAAQHGDHDLAIQQLEAALAGRIDLYGLANEVTLASLASLVDEVAEEDVDEALERLHDACRRLEGEADASRSVELIRQHEILLLRRADRLEEASAVALSTAEMGVRSSLRNAFREVIADPAAVEDAPTYVAAAMCLIVARIIPPDEPRLAPIASRFTDIVSRVMGFLMMPYMEPALFRQLSALGHGRRPGAEVADAARQFEELPSGAKTALGDASEASKVQRAEGLGLVEAIAREVLNEPEFVSLVGEGGSARPAAASRALLSNQAARRWLARTVYASATDEESREKMVASLLTFYAGLRLDLAKSPELDDAFSAIWSSPGIDAAVEAETPSLIEDLANAGNSEASATRQLLDASKAHAMFVAARDLEQQGQWEDAESMYERALAALEEQDRQNSLFGYVIQHDIGDVAAEQGKLDKAESCFEQALEGKIDVLPDWDEQIVITLLRLVDVLRQKQPDAARRRLEKAISEATDAGAEEQAGSMREKLRAWT